MTETCGTLEIFWMSQVRRSLEVAERKGGGASEIFSRRSIRYSLSVLVTAKRSSDFLLYKRSGHNLGALLDVPGAARDSIYI